MIELDWGEAANKTSHSCLEHFLSHAHLTWAPQRRRQKRLFSFLYWIQKRFKVKTLIYCFKKVSHDLHVFLTQFKNNSEKRRFYRKCAIWMSIQRTLKKNYSFSLLVTLPSVRERIMFNSRSVESSYFWLTSLFTWGETGKAVRRQ